MSVSQERDEMVQLKEVKVILESDSERVNEPKDSSSCAVKSDGEEDVMELLEVRPRFNASMIQEIFETMVTEIRVSFIQEYEIMLYDITRDYKEQLGCKELDMQSVASLHHLVQLNRSKNALSYQQAQTLEARLEDVLMVNTCALAEYELVKNCLELISAIVIKWGIVQMDLYNYRVLGRCLNVRLLDLASMNKQLMTLDTLWFIFTISDPPLAPLIDETTRQYAKVLYRQFINVLNFVLSLNSDCDFQTYPTIQQAVAANFKPYAVKNGIAVNLQDRDIPYQKLTKPASIFLFCKKTQEELLLINLKQQIADFELAFRTFEKSLISRLLIAKRPKTKSSASINKF